MPSQDSFTRGRWGPRRYLLGTVLDDLSALKSNLAQVDARVGVVGESLNEITLRLMAHEGMSTYATALQEDAERRLEHVEASLAPATDLPSNTPMMQFERRLLNGVAELLRPLQDGLEALRAEQAALSAKVDAVQAATSGFDGSGSQAAARADAPLGPDLSALAGMEARVEALSREVADLSPLAQGAQALTRIEDRLAVLGQDEGARAAIDAAAGELAQLTPLAESAATLPRIETQLAEIKGELTVLATAASQLEGPKAAQVAVTLREAIDELAIARALLEASGMRAQAEGAIDQFRGVAQEMTGVISRRISDVERALISGVTSIGANVQALRSEGGAFQHDRD